MVKNTEPKRSKEKPQESQGITGTIAPARDQLESALEENLRYFSLFQLRS
jgi:hypothetical protein